MAQQNLQSMVQQNPQQQLKIKFRIISFSGEDPEYPVAELLSQSPQSKGWQSPRFCDYPQEIILQLMSATRIKQLQFLSHQCKIASKVEIFVYMPDLYSNQQQEDFKFKKLGYLSLDNNERSAFQARELKSVYIDNPGFIINIIKNCQVGLIALTIFGETLKTQAERIHNPDPLPKGFESLEYEMQFDQKTLERQTILTNCWKRLRILSSAKEKALKFEDYEEAKRLKEGIERLKQIGTQLSYLEERKAIALNNEDYDSCQIIKSEIDRLRNAVTPEALLGKYGEQVSGFNNLGGLPPVQSSGYRGGGLQGGLTGMGQRNQMDEMVLRDRQLQTRKERQLSSKSPASYQPQNDIPMTRGQRGQSGNQMPQENISLEQHPTYQQEGLTNMREFDLEQQRKAIGQQKQLQWMEQEQPPLKEDDNLQFKKSQEEEKLVRKRLEERKKLPVGAIAHDEEVIPTIRHKDQGGPQEQDSGQEQGDANPYRSREAEDQVEELTEDVRAACVPLFGVLGEIICKKLFSKNWNMRDDALKWIHEQIKSRKGGLQGSEADQLVAILGAINFTISDKISSVYLQAVSLLMSTLEKYNRLKLGMKGEVGSFLEVILSNLVERIGESNARVRESAEDAFLALAKSSFVECGLVVKYLISTVVKGGGKEEGKKQQSKVGSIRHLAGRCKVLSTLINQCGVSSTGVPLNGSVDFSIGQLEHPNQEVRNAAVQVIVNLAKAVGYEKVRPLLSNVKGPQMEVLEKEMEKVRGGGHGGGNYEQNEDDEPEELVVIETNIGKKKSGKATIVSGQKQKPKQTQQNDNNDQQQEQQPQATQSNQLCEFCGKADRNFKDNQKYDLHLWKECSMLTTCQQCGQIIEISGLTEHLLAECQFKANFRRCARCKEAIALNEYKVHSEELSCNIAKPPNIANRCPLCHCDIPPKDAGWKKHLMGEGCPNNERTTY